jgi:hypothetical protein
MGHNQISRHQAELGVENLTTPTALKTSVLTRLFTRVCSTFTTHQSRCCAIVLRPLKKYIHEEKLISTVHGTLAPQSGRFSGPNCVTAPSLHVHARTKARNSVLSRPARKRLSTLLKHYTHIVSKPILNPLPCESNLPIKFCWLIGYPWFCASHLKNTMTSALKVNFHDPSEGMKLNTFMEPLGPTYRSQLKPARFTVVTFWPMG